MSIQRRRVADFLAVGFVDADSVDVESAPAQDVGLSPAHFWALSLMNACLRKVPILTQALED